MGKLESKESLENLRNQILEGRDPDKLCVTVCGGTGCHAYGCAKVSDAFREEIDKRGLADDVDIRITGCHGFCERGPIVVIYPKEIFYQSIKPEDVSEIVSETIVNGKILNKFLYTDPSTNEEIVHDSDVPFYKRQKRVVFRDNGKIDPHSIDDYIALGGYSALSKAIFERKPEEIIDEVKESGLRGRGGAGFPTGRKWEFCRAAENSTKYIICNADEGDPGAYMDRSILEGNPHSVLEGMIIGAYAIGAAEGYIYVRTEYQLAIENLKTAIKQAEEYGLLGENISGSGLNLTIQISEGAGAFVCGEETALMSSIEGKEPEPRQRPPFPAVSGLWGKPTNINNVETWANIPLIISNGAAWFAEIGTEKSKGTKIFSLVGKINNTGLVEVPMGMPLREIVYDIGGGIPGGKKFKAVQTGGPSGGCVPASLIDMPVDYERLKEIGSIMGSGGMVVMDEDTCMVDIAKYFLTFTNDESCGKCTSCREGSEALLEVLTRISEGKGEEEDITFLEELSQAVKDASLCGLGQTLPNPVISTLKHYREEYEAHIKYKRCPAVVCKEIISSACQHVCPLSQDASCYIGYIAQGKFKEAIEIVRRENPLPLVCGRVCHHPCEEKCKCGEGGGEAIAVRSLKRFLADYELEHGLSIEKSPEQARDEQVAVIGSGPAGLTCAHYLALEGYKVTIFESLPVAGGMLAVGIPEYRLPKEALQAEIDNIKKLGVEIKTNTAVGKDIQLSDLKKEYKAIFVAAGAHKGLKLGIPGEDSEGVLDAVYFLRKVNLGEEVTIGENVVVIGGGNAAVDAARVARRLGRNVRILYRRTRAEMPAYQSEVEEAIHEGIDIQFLAAPVKVLSSDGKMNELECIRMELGDIDKSGRRRPVPIEGSEFKVKSDTLLPAIGQEPESSFLADGGNLKLSGRNTMEVDPETLYAGEEGIFAGGDVVTGPNTVTDAMAHGKIAAQMIHKYIRGEKIERKYEVTRPALRVEGIELSEKEIEELKRPEVPILSPEQRAGNFKEVELCLSEEMAVREARRCLRCDLELEE